MDGTEFRTRRIAAGYKKRQIAADDIGVKYDTVKDWELLRRKVPAYATRWLSRVEKRAKKKGR